MRFLSLLILAPLAIASAITRRATAEDVNNDITRIDAAVCHLAAAVTAYQGGIQEAAPIFAAALAVHDVNRKGFADANATPRFTSAQSKAIVDNTNDSVGVSIPAGVEVIEAKKPLFDEAQISSSVKATIDLLKSDYETFSLAVGARLSLDQVAAGGVAAGQIDLVLQGASLFYTLP